MRPGFHNEFALQAAAGPVELVVERTFTVAAEAAM